MGRENKRDFAFSKGRESERNFAFLCGRKVFDGKFFGGSMAFAADGQLKYFLLSALFGVLSGAVKGAFPFRGRAEWAFDLCFFSAAGAAFLWFSYAFRFPDFRLYLAAGVFAGFLLSRKILSQFVAKPLRKWYNKSNERKAREKSGFSGEK